MKICQAHWDKLRAKLDELGIGHLGAKSGEDAIKNIVTELEGREAENDYDPLMACNHMISSQGLRVVGLSLMARTECCPICEAVKLYEQDWIDGPTNAALAYCQEQGLIKENGDELETGTDER